MAEKRGQKAPQEPSRIQPKRGVKQKEDLDAGVGEGTKEQAPEIGTEKNNEDDAPPGPDEDFSVVVPDFTASTYGLRAELEVQTRKMEGLVQKRRTRIEWDARTFTTWKKHIDNYKGLIDKYHKARDNHSKTDMSQAKKTLKSYMKKQQQNSFTVSNVGEFMEAARNLKVAQIQYEDFLYYQNYIHRRLMWRNLDEIERRNPHQPDWRAWSNRLGLPLGNLSEANIWLRTLLYAMADQRVGVYADRRIPIPTNQLLRWSPRSRWPLKARRAGNFEQETPPLAMDKVLDFDIIEKRRAEIEDRNRYLEYDQKRGVRYQSHTQRRNDEAQQLLYRDSPGRYVRNKCQVFISAAERSDDWPTSYDSLDRVKSSVVCVNPNIESDRSRSGPITNEIAASTEWMEATDGRREFHIHRDYPHSSPVNSPPNSPKMGPHNPKLPVDIDKTNQDFEMYENKFGDHFSVLHARWPFGADQVESMDEQERRNRCRVQYSPVDTLMPLNLPVQRNDTDDQENGKKRKRTDFEDPELFDEAGGTNVFKSPAPDGWSMHAWRGPEVLSLGDDQRYGSGHYGDWPLAKGFFRESILEADGSITAGHHRESGAGGFRAESPGVDLSVEDPYGGDLFRKSYHECSGVKDLSTSTGDDDGPPGGKDGPPKGDGRPTGGDKRPSKRNEVPSGGNDPRSGGDGQRSGGDKASSTRGGRNEQTIDEPVGGTGEEIAENPRGIPAIRPIKFRRVPGRGSRKIQLIFKYWITEKQFERGKKLVGEMTLKELRDAVAEEKSEE